MNGERVNRRKVKRYLDMLQTSSPSYILMASIDACIHLLEETQLQKCSIFREYAAHIDTLLEELKKLKYLKIIRTENTDRYDRSKFVISVKHAPMSSHELYERLLRDYHLQMEMLAGTYVLAMTTVGDTQEGLDRLRDALLAIDAEIDTKLKSGSGQEDAGQEQKPMQMTDTDLPLSGRQPSLEKVWTIAKAVKCRDKMQNQNHQKDSEDILYLVNPGKMEKRNFKDSAGCISLEYAYLYPPGSPLIVPGERITQEAVEILCWYQEHDFSIEGLQSEDSIEVWIDGEDILHGKSSSGKDTVYKEIRKELPELKTLTLYTTRPMREGEKDGVEYYFVSNEILEQYGEEGKIIELRTYQTVYGDWKYATIDDGQIHLTGSDYLMIGTLESYMKMKAYYGQENLVPLYIEVEDGERLMRAIARERQQEHPGYEEVCRRFLADQKDFSEENLAAAGITRRYQNDDKVRCKEEIVEVIRDGKL